MGLRVNNNIAALNSYNNLQKTDKAVNSSLQKLSSGLRINKAADDAAGLVISEGLRSQIGGLTVAARNAQDGVNVAQTADGALGTVTTILQRMRDLAVQASNTGSSDTAATTAAQTEITQLNKEIDRISSTTSFGSKLLLDGSYGTQFAKASSATQVSLSAIDGATTATGFKVTLAGSSTATADLTTNRAAGAYTNDAAGAALLESDLNAAILANNSGALANKVAAHVQFDDITKKATVSIARTDTSATADTLTIAGPTAPATLSFLAAGAASPTGNGAAFQVGANGTANDQIQVSIGTINSSGSGLNTGSISLSGSPQTAIATIDAALKAVSASRANLGALQNRFEYAISNLNVSIENITASESAIRDTDMAAEMTKFTKNQVLSQAGTSMLAQANSSSQNILTLLRG